MDVTSQLLLAIAKTFRISPAAAAVWIPLVITIANRVSKVIPDTQQGPLKWVRVAMTIVGINVDNNTGVSAVVDKTGAVIRRADPTQIPEAVSGVVEGVKPIADNLFTAGAKALREQINHSKDSDHAG